jgi:UDP-N-acetylmuramoyl-L-alanyl-D-glutamate--2,6-diaminopimelate ligase
MNLRGLLQDSNLEAPPGVDVEVCGITHDSRRVEAGDLFVAVPGENFDGRRFAPQAVERGAVAVLGRGEAPPELGVPWIAAEDPRAALGPLSARIYGHPDEQLQLVGVTGTNGKSTVVTLLGHVFEAAGLPAGTLGTLGYRFGGKALEAPTDAGLRTTPEAPDLFRTLRRMHEEGARAVAMEVSSHALELGRVDGAHFDAALFTNLTHDHLDFHRTMEAYFAAKRRLFDRLKPGGRSVVHLGDDWGRRLADELRPLDPGLLTCGEGGDVAVIEAKLDLRGVGATFGTPRGRLEVRSPLLGRYNLENLLMTVAVCEALGLDHRAVAAGLAAAGPVPGRLEMVEAGQTFPALIDYAHTPAALEAALRSLRELGDHRIAVVFGCGGNRDQEKRPVMGEIAGRLADLPVATSDNPRGEEPMAILKAVEEGLKQSGNREYRLVPDRREAIRRVAALATGQPGWAVLVAGKGHEEEQIIGGEKRPFSDREELRGALASGYAVGEGVGR